MRALLLPFTPRYIALTICICVTAALVALIVQWPVLLQYVVVPLAVFAALALLGMRDLFQTRHAILRNYPIAAHLRFLFEGIRPEMRQYFFESEKDGTPFSRDKRALVYQRAKMAHDKRPFGTQYDVYEESYEWISHSMAPRPASKEPFRVMVGGPDCAQPYSASVFNISAMSFGALSPNAVRALNKGAKLGNFAHDTGEGAVSTYHREHGGDLIWGIGSGYFGCRKPDGTFCAERFAETATDAQIKMIEIKLSQGAKPGHGGILPGAKVTREIAKARGVKVGEDCISPPWHSAFSTPIELMEFIADLKRLSGGKPVGFKLCVGHTWEFLALCKAMAQTGITPDFVVVDGKEGGTGAAPLEFADHVGMPLRDGLSFVHNALVGINVRQHVRIAGAGKITSAFDMVRAMALGADWCNAARGFMFAVGCIQAQACQTGHCPTGVTSQALSRQRALVVSDKSERVHNFHRATVEALAELIGAAGLGHTSELRPYHLNRRISAAVVATYEDLYPTLHPGALLAGTGDHRFKQGWDLARAESFARAS